VTLLFVIMMAKHVIFREAEQRLIKVLLYAEIDVYSFQISWVRVMFHDIELIITFCFVGRKGLCLTHRDVL
jgi:hypothetical protein